MSTLLDNLIIAHRGESFIAPENTLAAINLAWTNGVFAVEIDVHLTQDNEIVVIHDKSTKRTGNYKRSIRNSTLKVRAVDVGVFRGNEWKGERIPTLDEVFQTVPDNGKLIIEIKSSRAIIPKLVTEIQQSKLKISQIEVISYNLKVLSDIKRQIPEYKMLWILDLDFYIPAWMLWVNTRKIVRKVTENRLDGVNVWAGNAINKSFITQLKEQQLMVYTWTVNDVRTARKLFTMGVDAVTTDRPDWLKTQLMNSNL